MAGSRRKAGSGVPRDRAVDSTSARSPSDTCPSETALTAKRRAILEFIESELCERGYPPSVREIADAVGLASPSTVHAHLATLQRQGYLRRDPAKPRAIEVRLPSQQDEPAPLRPIVRVPVVGRVAAGTDVLAEELVEEVLSLPADLTGGGRLFALRVRGDSMRDVGILDGDLIVVRSQAEAPPGSIVVAGIPGDEATVKRYEPNGATIRLRPENPAYEPIVLPADEVRLYGRVVSVLRRL
jgi:repressor LexA